MIPYFYEKSRSEGSKNWDHDYKGFMFFGSQQTGRKRL